MYYTEKGSGLLPEEEKDDPSTDRVKIGDFTLAMEVKAEDMYIEGSDGTEAFLAPEVINPEITWYLPRPLDIWALGVTLHAYLFESVPFYDGETKADRASRDYTLNFEGRVISEEGKDFLQGLLQKDPKARLTID